MDKMLDDVRRDAISKLREAKEGLELLWEAADDEQPGHLGADLINSILTYNTGIP